jgi:hypothetical protein
MSPTFVITEAQQETLLAVLRLGDDDRLGWWRSHSVDETAQYVLGHAFPHTWMAAGLELAMASARIRHDYALARSSAIHLFSDYLPFHRLLRSWLIERKLERDYEPLAWLRDAAIQELRDKLEGPVEGERRGGGVYVGDVYPNQLKDDNALSEIVSRLTGAYATLGTDFRAPYLDLVR